MDRQQLAAIKQSLKRQAAADRQTDKRTHKQTHSGDRQNTTGQTTRPRPSDRQAHTQTHTQWRQADTQSDTQWRQAEHNWTDKLDRQPDRQTHKQTHSGDRQNPAATLDDFFLSLHCPRLQHTNTRTHENPLQPRDASQPANKEILYLWSAQKYNNRHDFTLFDKYN